MEMMQQPQFIMDTAGQQLAVLSLKDYHSLVKKAELYDELANTPFVIPEEHLEEIRLGKEDIKNGRIKTSKEVRERALKICMK